MTKKTHKNRNPGRDPSRKIEIEIKNDLKAPPAFIPFTGNMCFSADKKGMKTQEQVTPMYNAFPELGNRAPALDEVLHPIPATIGPGASASGREEAEKMRICKRQALCRSA